VPRIYNSRKRMLVTGGSGFLESHLIDRLLENGHDVLCVHNLFTGTKRNIEHLAANPRFGFMRHDVTFPLYVEADENYNLACPLRLFTTSMILCRRRKRRCTVRLTCWASPSGLSAVFFVKFTAIPSCIRRSRHIEATSIRSDCAPAATRASAAPKRCSLNHRQHGVEIKVARILNTYGRRMHPSDGRVVSNFVVQALKGESITLYGTGNQTRSFCYVSDLIEGLIRLMEIPADVTGPVNLGNSAEFTMTELAELVLAEAGAQSATVLCPLPDDNPKQRCPDITVAKSILGWAPAVPLREGIKPTISYFRSLCSTCPDRQSSFANLRLRTKTLAN